MQHKYYSIKFSRKYLKDLEKVHPKYVEKVKMSIFSLIHNPRPDGCKKLKGQNENLYRIRCGIYRIIYTIQDDKLIVIIVDVGHRKDVYD